MQRYHAGEPYRKRSHRHNKQGHSDSSSSICFFPDEKTLVTESFDCTIKLCGVSRGCLHFNSYRKSPVCLVCGDGTRLASGREKHTQDLGDCSRSICLQMVIRRVESTSSREIVRDTASFKLDSSPNTFQYNSL